MNYHQFRYSGMSYLINLSWLQHLCVVTWPEVETTQRILTLTPFHINKLKVVFFNKFRRSNLSTPHCQSPRTQFLVCQYLHMHLLQGSSLAVTARAEVGAIQAWFPAVASIVWESVLLTPALDQLDDCFRSRCFFCHNGDPFILPFLPSEFIWLWQTRTAHFIIVLSYHLIVGAENCFIKCSLCWWNPIWFRLIFSEHISHLSSLTCEIPGPGW